MAKFNLLVIDPPYEFGDKLTMSKVKRGADAQYDGTLTSFDIAKLKIPEITAPEALIGLWVPSAHIVLGMKLLEAWGFDYKQTFIWVKRVKEPLEGLRKRIFQKIGKEDTPQDIKKVIRQEMDAFDCNDICSMFLGRTFRQCHEVALIGHRGKINKYLELKNQRSVVIDYNNRHSNKPEGFQDRLEIMYPSFTKRVELFARRDRAGWECSGNECPSTLDEDVHDSIERLIKKQ